jgi:hypothetical protein
MGTIAQCERRLPSQYASAAVRFRARERTVCAVTHHVHILEMNGDSFRLKTSRNKKDPVAPTATDFGGGFPCALSATP